MTDPRAFHLFPEEPDAVPEPVASGTHRPERFRDIVGQKRLVERLTVHVAAAVARGAQPAHVLLSGPAGVGKTTIASALANEITDRGVACRMHEVTGDAITTVKALALQLAQLSDGDLLFVDEAHSIKPPIQLALLRALEDGFLYLPGDSRSTAQRLTLPRFTLVCATTDVGRLSGPLTARFGFHGMLELYLVDDMELVVQAHAERLGVAITPDAVTIIAKASRYTPRTAIRLLSGCRDWMLSSTGDLDAKLDAQMARDGLVYCEVDEFGLDSRDHRYLRTLCQEYLGGPAGIAPLASSLGMDAKEIAKAVEPYLLTCGLVKLAPRGRVATKAAYTVLGLTPPPLIGGLMR